jgi:hypothetical protein
MEPLRQNLEKFEIILTILWVILLYMVYQKIIIPIAARQFALAQVLGDECIIIIVDVENQLFLSQLNPFLDESYLKQGIRNLQSNHHIYTIDGVRDGLGPKLVLEHALLPLCLLLHLSLEHWQISKDINH